MTPIYATITSMTKLINGLDYHNAHTKCLSLPLMKEKKRLFSAIKTKRKIKITIITYTSWRRVQTCSKECKDISTVLTS